MAPVRRLQAALRGALVTAVASALDGLERSRGEADGDGDGRD